MITIHHEGHARFSEVCYRWVAGPRHDDLDPARGVFNGVVVGFIIIVLVVLFACSATG